MRNLKDTLKKCILIVLLAFVMIGFVACDDPIDDGEDPATDPVTITVEASSERITTSETVTLTVTITNTEDTTYTWEISDETLVAINNNVLSVIGTIKVDKMVTVTAVSTADSTKSASKTIVITAPVIAGQVGELTSEMLQELGNASITVTGVLTDYYTNFKQSNLNSTNKYDMSVKMSDGAWSGAWNSQDNKDNVNTDNYRKGETDNLTDQYGNTGHGLERLYIDKDNKVASALVKDYLSTPSIWEAQHLWNHIANLQINKFVYDVENEVYEYRYSSTDIDDLYLMTYLSYSLTPLLEDTLVEVYLKVEDGKITKLLGQTEILYYGSDTQDDADAMSYTTVELEFSNVGTTTVVDPTPYEAPENADKLSAALAQMSALRNYSFQATDTTTYAPSTDDSDYEIESTLGGIVTLSYAPQLLSVQNNTSSQGQVGCFGQVTESAVLFADTGRYDYTMDGKIYHTEYSGYKQNDDGTYDEFEYNSTQKALVGTKKVTGNIFDDMPTFTFSPNVFTFSGSSTSGGKTLYTYYLNDSAITRDVAMEISCYKYADDAAPSASTRLSITVDGDGNVVSAVYPYSLINGTYIGYVTTTFSEIGTTVLDEDLFDGYVPRVLKTSWSQYTTKYYSTTHSTLDSHDEDTSVVLSAIYGSDVETLPAPSVFMNILGDNIHGPFYDWREKGTDADGNTIYSDFISITVSTDNYDENMQMTDYEETIEEITTALRAEGYSISLANTDTSGSTRYVCYIKGNVQIVIENNHSRYFWIYFYKTGDWTLKR